MVEIAMTLSAEKPADGAVAVILTAAAASCLDAPVATCSIERKCQLLIVFTTTTAGH